MQITITLFDFTDLENPKEPLNIAMQYVGDPDPLEFGPKKVTIAVGDDVACGTISIPLNVLSQLMSQLMAADQKRSIGGILVPPSPKIILPS